MSAIFESRIQRRAARAVLVAALLCVAHSYASAEGLSHWALRTPAVLIGLPGDPAPAAISWAGPPAYFCCPNSWAAEGSGCRVEVAGLFTRDKPAGVPAVDEWRSYPIGDAGLYLDLPRAPDPTKLNGSTRTTGVLTGSLAVDVREVTYAETAYDVDAGARQLLEFMKAWPGHNNVQGTIEKRLIDGLDARLIKTTHQHAGFTNYRYMLLIYSSDRFWAVDAIAAVAEKYYLDQVVDSARVQLPLPSGQPRQQVGRMGVTLVAGPKRIEVRGKEITNDADLVHMERADVDLGPVVLTTYEVTMKGNAPSLEGDLPLRTATSIIKVVGDEAGVRITPTLRDQFPVEIDDVEGVRFIFDLTSDKGTETIRGDYLLLRRGKYWWSAFVLSRRDAPDSRAARVQIFNSIRVAR